MNRKRKLDEIEVDDNETNIKEGGNNNNNKGDNEFLPPAKKRVVALPRESSHSINQREDGGDDSDEQQQQQQYKEKEKDKNQENNKISSYGDSNNNNNTFQVEWFGASDKGKKPHMEDRRIEIPSLSQYSRIPYFQHNQCSLFGILDGHGGYKVATYLQTHLPLIFLERFEQHVRKASSTSYEGPSNNNNNNNNNDNSIPPLERAISSNSDHNSNITNTNTHIKEEQKQDIKILEMQKCLHATFKITDQKILNWISPVKREGATSTLIFRDNNTFWCANVGDSKAVLARRDAETGKLKPLQLSKDHTVLQLSEVRRVEACGGHVANGRVNGVLEITRSFGDPEFKKYGVISVPQISKFEITERDEFLVAACDGLWSVFSIADCIKFVNEKFHHKSQPDVREVVRQLLAEAILNKQAKDNVSAIIIRFKHQS